MKKSIGMLSSAIFLVMISFGPRIAVAGGKAKACAKNLGSCPAEGCAQAGTGEALTNKQKRHSPTGDKATMLTLDDFETLQEQADKLVGQKKDLTKEQRAKLTKLKVSGGQVAEGDLVETTGYLVGSPHPNKSGESVNCRLKGDANNDFHIPLARNPDDTEFEGIVVEMVPQDRPAEWTIAKLRRIKKQSQEVRVRGQLFYDNKHKVNDDPEDPLGGQPKRFALWEIHAVTGFFVCPKEPCGTDIAEWQKLETFK